MGILDEAIREHIDLKRKHGAAESEVRKLEDDAFGPPVRPGDPEGGETVAAVAEGGVETVPEAEAPAVAPPDEDMPPTEIVPPASEPEPAAEAPAPPEPEPPAPEDAPVEPPIEEEQPAMEHPTVAHPPPEPEPEPEPVVEAPPSEHEAPAPEADEPPAAAGEESSTVDQPTEFYDFESEMTEGEGAPAPKKPSEALGEPPSEEPEPSEAAPAAEPDDDLLSEQSLSDELDRALEAPETEEAPAVPEPGPEEPREEHVVEQGGDEGEDDFVEEGEEAEQGEEDGEEDVLEETPEFLQDTPEHDRLWFEQKPPKDFDFDE
jgi:hypothetical protein